MPEVKICGNRRREDIEYASGADYLGFIIQIERSPRSLTVAEAKPLIAQASGAAQTVAVVDGTDTHVLSEICEQLEPDYLQVQVETTPQTILDIKEVLGVQVIALVSATPGAADRARAMAEVADIVLVDSAFGGKAGGTGTVHDWTLSRGVRDAIYPSMLMLAGGLNPENVVEAARTVRPAIVDVSGGVEVNGTKSKELVSSFISRAKGVADD